MTGPTAAPRGFPYPHPTMAEVKREEFYDALAEGMSEAEAAAAANMTPEQADVAMALLMAELGDQAA